MKRFILILILSGLYVCSAVAQEAVDLGLSVNWATYNVGATAPEEVGGLFICGTIKPWNNSVNPHEAHVCVNHDYDYSGDPDYDVAAEYWSAGWRTPTFEEWMELFSECKCKKTKVVTNNGNKISGVTITGPNGNSIFLPHTMNHFFGGANKYGLYQTSTPVDNKEEMYVIYIQFGIPQWMYYKYGGMYRNLGFATRAVIDK